MELVTVRETAQMPRVSPISVRRSIASGRLPAMKVGRGVRLHRADVDRLLTVIAPKPVARRPRLPIGTPFTMDDPLWSIIGIGRSDEPTNTAEHKDEHLADAYAPRKE